MTEKSPGKEFLELAIEIERNGFRFYKSAAQNWSNDVGSVFMQLSGREREHEHTFRDMLTRIGGYLPENACEDYQYVKTLADSTIFAGKDAILKTKTMTDVAAIEAGVGFEKDSILLYSEVKGMVPRQDQDIMEMIINEEKKHLSELSYLLNKVRSG